MKLAIMQPYLFPYIGYFQLISAVDTFIVYDDVSYIKGGWINRNRILVNSKACFFTTPINDASSYVKIKDTSICSSSFNFWRGKFLKTIQASYKRAPFFDEVYMILTDTFEVREETTIGELATKSIINTSNYLGIKTKIIKSSSIFLNDNLSGQSRLIDICKKANAGSYINPIGGQEIYDKLTFYQNGIHLKFLKSKMHVYRQFDSDFIPWLSIIDVIMFNSKEEIRNLINEYELI